MQTLQDPLQWRWWWCPLYIACINCMVLGVWFTMENQICSESHDIGLRMERWDWGREGVGRETWIQTLACYSLSTCALSLLYAEHTGIDSRPPMLSWPYRGMGIMFIMALESASSSSIELCVMLHSHETIHMTCMSYRLSHRSYQLAYESAALSHESAT